jgi:hypothetical protein
MLNAGDLDDAVKMLRRKPEGRVAKAEEAGLQASLGDAIWQQYLHTTGKEGGSPDRKAVAVKEAVELLDRAATAGDAEALYLLGYIEEETGDARKAREHYEAGLKKHPDQQRLFNTAIRRLNARPRPGTEGRINQAMPARPNPVALPGLAWVMR